MTLIRRWLQKGRGEKGFTIIELMVVVAIIGILAALAIPTFAKSTDESRYKKTKADLKNLSTAVQLYYFDHNFSYPDTTPETKLVPDYIKKIPQDGWKQDYGYNPTQHEFYSKGPGGSSTLYIDDL